MSYASFYRYIYKYGDKYWIIKDNERYVDCKTLAEALYERDRFEGVGWDWDKYVQLPHTINGYIHISLPPFEHKSRYIYHKKERWMVRGKGKRCKYYGTYHSVEEAEEVARIYNANISYLPETYGVRKRINGELKHFGTYATREEAEAKVNEMIKVNWNVNTT